ncbi:MAG: hypothetical protein HRT40_06405 [Campylobacteraceae bacterium]|nr:hypothetical protein [Campylobacteraceae bacterium]
MKSKYIAGLTSIIAIVVTLFQVHISDINKNKELELARIQSDSNYKLAQLHEERTWKYKMTEFMAKYKKDIFSDDLNTRKNIQKIMMVSFPNNITTKIFTDLAKISNKDDWLKALYILRRVDQPTVFIQITKDFPEEIIEPISDTIAGGDISYVTNDEYIDNNLTEGDVRYFFEEDELLAKKVLNDFKSMACTQGYELNLKLLSFVKNKDRNIKGTIEVWLSTKSAKKIKDKKHDCYYEEENI